MGAITDLSAYFSISTFSLEILSLYFAQPGRQCSQPVEV